MVEEKKADDIIKLLEPELKIKPNNFYYNYFYGKALQQKKLNMLVPIYMTRALKSNNKNDSKLTWKLEKDIYLTLFNIYRINRYFEPAKEILKKGKNLLGDIYWDKLELLEKNIKTFKQIARSGTTNYRDKYIDLHFILPDKWISYTKNEKLNCLGRFINKNRSLDIRVIKFERNLYSQGQSLGSKTERKNLVFQTYDYVKTKFKIPSSQKLKKITITGLDGWYFNMSTNRGGKVYTSLIWIPLKKCMVQIVITHTNPALKGKLLKHVFENLTLKSKL